MDNKFTKIAEIGSFITDNGDEAMAARLLLTEEGVPFTPMSVGSSCVALYEAFLKYVPDKDQIAFEEHFKKLFPYLLENRMDYLEEVSVPIDED